MVVQILPTLFTIGDIGFVYAGYFRFIPHFLSNFLQITRTKRYPDAYGGHSFELRIR